MTSKRAVLDPTPIATYLLQGFTPRTVFAGLRVGDSDLDVIAALGPPTEHTPTVELENGGRLWYVNYHRERAFPGLETREFLDFSGGVFPDGSRRLNAVSLMLHGPAEADPMFAAAAKAMKADLASRFRKGPNLSTFRAAFQDDDGFVAVWSGKARQAPRPLPAMLRVTAGLE